MIRAIRVICHPFSPYEMCFLCDLYSVRDMYHPCDPDGSSLL